MNRYRVGLMLLVAAVWIWAAIRPFFRHDWLLENLLVFLFVPLVIASGRYFRLSDVSYTLIALFTCLHLVGAHYTYSEVPFGFLLQQGFGADRNLYDRLVHFSFGLLLAYPVREVFLRLARVKGLWGFYLPLDVTLSLSAIYEILEWRVAEHASPEAGLAFLGSQGDVWDAQKDMLLAGLGALLTMLVVMLINWKWDPNFGCEMRESFGIQECEPPLGERAMGQAVKNRVRRRRPPATSGR